jgi:hypothetical protein
MAPGKVLERMRSSKATEVTTSDQEARPVLAI